MEAVKYIQQGKVSKMKTVNPCC